MVQNKNRKKAEIPAAEWAVAGIGALLVLLALIVLIIDATRSNAGPPVVTFAIDTVHSSQGGYVAEISVRNSGARTAAGLLIEGTLSNAGAAVERSEVILDYLPAHSSRRIGLIFQQNPRAHVLSVRALGYQRD